MLKNLVFAMLVVAVVPATAQTTVFSAAGLTFITPKSGLFSLGVGHTVKANTDIFVDILVAPNAPTRGAATSLMAGTKYTLPAVSLGIGKYKTSLVPYGAVAYGATLVDVVSGAAFQGINVPSSVTPADLVKALGTAPRFTQQYIGGLMHKGKLFDWGFGARIQKETGIKPYPDPFMLLSKTFK